MKDFRTELIPAASGHPADLKDKFFTIGSCFADAIGSHLEEYKFSTWNNRFGTVYNPVSIHRLLKFALENKLPTPESYLVNEEIYANYHFHSSYSSSNKSALETKVKTSVDEANLFLKKANRIIITYGTAFVYRLKSNQEVVANCHKAPASNFTKSLLTETAIVESFKSFYSAIKSINPTSRIILTVSPVRHLKDTLELNAVSKSILRLSCHSIVAQFPDVEYFPAYEILFDDLRDYRFYKPDRLHPTDEAVEYIWDKFAGSFFNESTKSFIDKWREIKGDLRHKPFHPDSDNHQKFLKGVLKRLEALSHEADISPEIDLIKSKIVPRHSSS